MEHIKIVYKWVFTMNKLFRQLLIVLFTFNVCACTAAKQITLVNQTKNPNSYELEFDVPLAKGDGMYQDDLSFSVDHPDVSIVNWKPSIDPENKYDTTFKKNKKIFTQPFAITVNLQTKDPTVSNARLYVTYYLTSQKNITQKSFPLTFQSTAPPVLIEEEQQEPAITCPPTQPPAPNLSWSATLSNVLTTTESWWVRLLLALLLGFLLSLTPCIYPMIPITVGILQSQGSKSVIRNFLLSLTYTSGIATTFALLGIIAAFSGKMFGNIMNNPLVIMVIIALIVYLAGSMIGWYDLYIPSWLQPKNKAVKGGSLLSIFMFGIASGTVASPCLSPGLLLLLTLVTTLNNMLLGFGLLFVFGLGLGIPLLIIGTFSGSLNVLPRAGQWMVDVKQLFGFIMLATGFYFLQVIVPWHIVSVLFFVFTAVVGTFYLYSAQRSTKNAQLLKNLLGIALIALSVYLLFYAYKVGSMQYNPCPQTTIWLQDYEQARALACKEHKNILLDIGAPCCSMCSAIDKKVFANPLVEQQLKNVIPVHIGNIEENECTQELQKKFKIMGAPTILLINPDTQCEIKRWGSELYDADVSEFAKQLQ